MMTEHGERKIDTFFWCLIALAVIYLIGHLVVAFTRDAFDTPSIPLRPTPTSAPAAPLVSTTSSTTSALIVRTSSVSGVWDRLAQCESSRRWNIANSIHQGGLQFAVATWDAFVLPGYPADAQLASREQQITVAKRVLRAQGVRAWPKCGPRVGLTMANAR